MVISIPLAGWFGWGREYREAFSLAIEALGNLQTDLREVRETEERQTRVIHELLKRDRARQGRLKQAMACFGHTTCEKGHECALAIKLVSECVQSDAGNGKGAEHE